MGKFTYTDPQGVTLFQRSLNTIRADKAARKDPPMPITKSMSDLAWEAFSAAARALVTAKTYRTYEEAVDALKAASHPAYLTYLASLSSGSTSPAPGDVTKRAAAVVKASEEATFQKRREVETELQKRATALVRSGAAPNEAEAVREVFKRDRGFYNRHRELTYAKGPVVPPPPPDTVTFGPRPVDAQVTQMAQALRQDDPWGQFVGKSEAEMVGEVFKRHPALYQAYTREVMR